MSSNLLFSLGLIAIGFIAAVLIYWIGTRRVTDAGKRMNAMRWNILLALSICASLGIAPFVSWRSSWLLLFVSLGAGMTWWSAYSLGRIVNNPEPVAHNPARHWQR